MYDKNTKTLLVHGSSIHIVVETVKQWLDMGARPERIVTSYGEHEIEYRTMPGTDDNLVAIMRYDFPGGVGVFSGAAGGLYLNSPEGFVFTL